MHVVICSKMCSPGREITLKTLKYSCITLPESEGLSSAFALTHFVVGPERKKVLCNSLPFVL